MMCAYKQTHSNVILLLLLLHVYSTYIGTKTQDADFIHRQYHCNLSLPGLLDPLEQVFADDVASLSRSVQHIGGLSCLVGHRMLNRSLQNLNYKWFISFSAKYKTLDGCAEKIRNVSNNSFFSGMFYIVRSRYNFFFFDYHGPRTK